MVLMLTKRTEKKEHNEHTVLTETGDDDVDFIDEGEGLPHISHVNNIPHSLFSMAELYITNHQIYIWNGFYAQKSHICNKFGNTLTE